MYVKLLLYGANYDQGIFPDPNTHNPTTDPGSTYVVRDRLVRDDEIFDINARVYGDYAMITSPTLGRVYGCAEPMYGEVPAEGITRFRFRIDPFMTLQQRTGVDWCKNAQRLYLHQGAPQNEEAALRLNPQTRYSPYYKSYATSHGRLLVHLKLSNDVTESHTWVITRAAYNFGYADLTDALQRIVRTAKTGIIHAGTSATTGVTVLDCHMVPNIAISEIKLRVTSIIYFGDELRNYDQLPEYQKYGEVISLLPSSTPIALGDGMAVGFCKTQQVTLHGEKNIAFLLQCDLNPSAGELKISAQFVRHPETYTDLTTALEVPMVLPAPASDYSLKQMQYTISQISSAVSVAGGIAASVATGNPIGLVGSAIGAAQIAAAEKPQRESISIPGNFMSNMWMLRSGRESPTERVQFHTGIHVMLFPVVDDLSYMGVPDAGELDLSADFPSLFLIPQRPLYVRAMYLPKASTNIAGATLHHFLNSKIANLLDNGVWFV